MVALKDLKILSLVCNFKPQGYKIPTKNYKNPVALGGTPIKLIL